MRRQGHHGGASSARQNPEDAWSVFWRLWPYLWPHRLRMGLALSCLLIAKCANLGVPLLLKVLVDHFALNAVWTVPASLLIAYGLLRLSTTLFTEFRELVFMKVTQRALRQLSLNVFEHLHALSLRFHLERRTGGLARDIERGTRSMSSLISYTLFSIFPTLVEVTLVMGTLAIKYEILMAAIALATLILYIAFTFKITEYRTGLRRQMNDLDSKASTHAIDSLLNFETVKYFGNEAWERDRYDNNLAQWETAALRTQKSLSLLNIGQSTLIAIGITCLMWRVSEGVVAKVLTLGDLVLVNTLMIQLYIPLNFLGVIYREIRQATADLEQLFVLLDSKCEVQDAPDAYELVCKAPPLVEFENIRFGYNTDRCILHGISFSIPAGHTVAVVGASGAGKSTLARLLFRFYDVQSGAIKINGADIRKVTQHSLRRTLGIVPQDTVLFNDTLAYNIAYGKPGASQEAIEASLNAAHLSDFILRLPQGLETSVGERGLKLSGGEKQRVAIARTLLKSPPILVLDEATSALDSHAERAIQTALDEITARRTTLIIAHRLSTIIHADEIIVLDQGNIVERGTHMQLLLQNGRYAQLWNVQHKPRAIVTESQEESINHVDISSQVTAS
ncbi:MAG: ABC transporter ATP-binding protein/permease [Pseudomonadota bacterium]